MPTNLIQALGGKVRIATEIGVPPKALKKWHTRGVPYKYWLPIIEMGASMTPPVQITESDLKRTRERQMETA